MGTTRPPAGVEADDAAFGILGVRVAHQLGSRLTLHARGQVGAGARTEDGRWLFGGAEAVWAHSLGPLQALIDGDAFALRYDRPYDYDARAIRVRPGLAAAIGRTRVEVRAELLRGDWSSRFFFLADEQTGATLEVRRTGVLRVDGGAASIGARAGRVDVEIGVGVREVENGALDGRYVSGHATGVLPVGPVTLFGTLRLQDAAGIGEVGGALGATTRVSQRVSVAGVLARAVTDVVYGTRPGIGVTLSASVRLGGERTSSSDANGVVAVGVPADGRRTVTLRLEHDAPGAVEVAGSFNAWTPVPMTRDGDAWIRAFRLEPGTYTFAFRLADGTWFVPDDAPGIVDDGFGRRNATIVVPPL